MDRLEELRMIEEFERHRDAVFLRRGSPPRELEYEIQTSPAVAHMWRCWQSLDVAEQTPMMWIHLQQKLILTLVRQNTSLLNKVVSAAGILPPQNIIFCDCKRILDQEPFDDQSPRKL